MPSFLAPQLCFLYNRAYDINWSKTSASRLDSKKQMLDSVSLLDLNKKYLFYLIYTWRSSSIIIKHKAPAKSPISSFTVLSISLALFRQSRFRVISQTACRSWTFLRGFNIQIILSPTFSSHSQPSGSGPVSRYTDQS